MSTTGKQMIAVSISILMFHSLLRNNEKWMTNDQQQQTKKVVKKETKESILKWNEKKTRKLDHGKRKKK